MQISTTKYLFNTLADTRYFLIYNFIIEFTLTEFLIFTKFIVHKSEYYNISVGCCVLVYIKSYNGGFSLINVGRRNDFILL